MLSVCLQLASVSSSHHLPAYRGWRPLLAEWLGTFLLTFVAAGANVIDAVSGGEIGRASAVTAPGLIVLAMIYTLGEVSGAHLNPAVTFAFAARGDFPWSKVVGYWLAQFSGAVLAAALLRLFFGNVANLGSTLPHYSIWSSLMMETLLTTALIGVIFGTAVSYQIVGHNAAFAISGTIIAAGLFASPISGASMNPARSFGPALVSGSFDSAWVYFLGPLWGALIAVFLMTLFRGSRSLKERQEV